MSPVLHPGRTNYSNNEVTDESNKNSLFNAIRIADGLKKLLHFKHKLKSRAAKTREIPQHGSISESCLNVTPKTS